MSRTDVLVIGAGAAGLVAAGRLAAGGRHVLLVEARERLGGRIHTLHDAALSYPVELGAEFLQCQSCELLEIVKTAGLVVREIPDWHQRPRGNQETPLPDPRELLDHLLFHESFLRDRPVAELIREAAGRGVSPADLDVVTSYIEGFHAADLERMGTHDLAENQAAEAEDGERQFRLLGGYDQLVHHLSAQLPRELVEVRTGTVARQLRWCPGEVRAQVSSDRGMDEITASQAIVTLPLGVLKKPEDSPGAMRIEPEPPAWRHAFGALEMGAAHRVVFRFDEAWWIRPDRPPPIFVHGKNEPFPVWWTASPPQVPLLTGWIGGPRAIALAGRDPSEMLRLALESAATIFDHPAGALARRVQAAYHHDWWNDPLSRGAYSYGGVGAAAARQTLARPVESTLFLAGEATIGGRNATVHGAIASGLRAASAVLGEPLASSRR